MLRATAGGCVAIALGLPLLLILLITAGGNTASGAGGPDGAPTAYARQDIPAEFLRWYLDAAGTCPGLPWGVLAGIGKSESDHGRSRLPGIRSGENHAGAGGPMQFLAPTWAAYRVDGDHDGHADRYNPADAIYGAARYLCANGAGRGGTQLRRAIWHYNHADWYVRKVLALAGKYAAPTGSSRGGTAVRAALRWLGTPYSWGGGGPAGPSTALPTAPESKASTAPASPNTPGPRPVSASTA